jgi:KipI family sensor histidine kinase inhibitor
VTEQDIVVRPFGDSAVLVSLGDRVDRRLNRRARRIAAAVAEERTRGLPFGAPVPAYASVLVPFELERMTTEAAQAEVARIAWAVSPEGANDDAAAGRMIEIQTTYDGEDLRAVAERVGLTTLDVIEMHASTEYEVFMLGFAPGFAYLGVLPEAIAVPRLASPRPRVPTGRVAIAERQTAVYPSATPGGWNLIGRTDVVMWDVNRNPPSLLAPGDRVRFVPVTSSR